MTPQDASQALIAAGISVIPIKTDGSKTSAIPWKPYQSEIMPLDEARSLFSGHVGIAVIGGAVSGNLEILDIEAEAPIAELSSLITEHLPGFLPRLPQVRTPSGGRHIFYRCPTIAPNQKLAMTANAKVLIETRGEGGYVLTVTSPPECHESGKTYDLAVGSLLEIPTVTPEQREVLLSCCRSFNRLIRDVEPPPVSTAVPGQGLRPGDDFNARGDGLAALLKAGWKVMSRGSGEVKYLQRPGKTGKGFSASFGYVGHNCLHVFSSNAAPFDFERKYDAFGVFAMLEFGGDLTAAARELSKQGFGDQPKPRALAQSNGSAARPAVEQPKPELLPEVTETNVELVYQTMEVTEHNVAIAFEDLYKNQLRYCHSWGKWMTWVKTHWQIDQTLLAFHYCRTISAKLNSYHGKAAAAKASFARGVEAFCRAARTFATESKQWDGNDFLFNSPTQTVNLKTESVSVQSPSDYITKCAAVSPAEGPHPVFDRFLKDITLEDEGLVQYHQRALGACLSGGIQDNFLLFWYGTGQNGKNTFGDLIQWIFGDYATVLTTETLMAQRAGATQHLTFLADLRGIRLAISSEVEEGSYFNEARIKQLTGDATIKANRMRQDPFEFRRTHKHLVYGNHRPSLRIVDPAIRSRLHVVPFKAHFPPDARDPEMAGKLRAEAPQILQWLIDGHRQWLEDGYLKKCSAVQAETDAYFDAQSTPELWISEFCIIDVDRSASAKDLYGSFKAWKESRGEGVMSQHRWGEWMSQRGFMKVHVNGRVVYRGLSLNESPKAYQNYQS